MSAAPVTLRIVASKHRAKRPVNSCRHFKSGSQPLSCLPCRRDPLPGGKRRAPKHRADVPVDSCRYGEQEGVAPCETCAEVDQLAPRVHRADVTA